MIEESENCGEISLSPPVAFVFDTFYEFMFNSVYINMKAKSEETKVYGIIDGIYDHYVRNPDELPEDFRRFASTEGLRRTVSDYVSGMSDKYAIHVYEKLFIPDAWQVR